MRRRRGALKASTALIGVVLLSATALLGTASPAGANGRGGDGGGSVNTGGDSDLTGAGDPGLAGSGGSGGGGGGLTGGAGGIGAGAVSGGAGGSSAGAAGGPGGVAVAIGSGGGGGGGAHGSVSSVSPGLNVTGGDGGRGGDSIFNGSLGGGGGGGGGFGLVLTGSATLGVTAAGGAGGAGGNANATSNGSGIHGGNGGGGGGGLGIASGAGSTVTAGAAVTGGAGGAGGSSSGDRGGAGGAGGTGILINDTNVTLTINATVAGGNGGAGGYSTGTTGGAGGDGGHGVVANGATIMVNASVHGGLGGAGGPGTTPGATGASGAGIKGNALTITLGAGGSITDADGAGPLLGNALQLTGNSKLTVAVAGTANIIGNIDVVSGTLTLDQASGIDVTIANTITGGGGLAKTGAGMVTLTGTNTYSGGTTISAGTLSVSSNANLGASGTTVTLNNTTNVGGAGTGADAILRTTATFSSNRNIAFTNAGGGRIETDSGTTLTLSGSITTGGSASFIKQGAGMLVLTGDSSANYFGRTWVNAGTLRIEGGGKLGSNGFSGQAYISNGATAIVTGLGSSWESFGQMRVGEHGSGTLLIEAGGSVKTGSGGGTAGIVGGGGDSSVTITGTNSQWFANAANIYVGHSNAGTLTVSDGGSLKIGSASNGTIIAGLSAGGAGGTINIGAAEGSAAAATGDLLVGTVSLVASASQLVFNHTSSSYSFTPVISGAGSVRQVAGTTVLTGTNSYTGGTVILGGVLSVSKDSNLGATSGALTLDGGVLQVTGTTLTALGRNIVLGNNGGGFDIVEAGNTFTVTQGFSGSGSFSKTGAGILVLTGAHSYSGVTTVAGGTLRAGQASSFSGSSAFKLSSGTTLDLGGFDQTVGSLAGAGAVTLGAGTLTAGGDNTSTNFSGSITGTGGLTKTGSGTLGLSGTNTYSGATKVQQGRLYAANAGALSATSDYTIAGGAALEIIDFPGLIAVVGSIAGAGSIQIGTGATLKAGGSNASTSFSGKIEGSGSLTKTGTGTLTLSGTSTYGGATKVEGGKLVVNGSLASSVTVESGSTLGGSGTVGTTVVNGGATVAPGNSIGTLSVSGNVSFASGSTYQVEINAAGQSDRIVASGSATITGGTVQVLAENGNYAAATNYTILTASGGVSGRFSTVTSNLAFLTPSLSYGGTNVTLTMTRNDTSFGPGGGSTGGGSTGSGTGTGGSTSGSDTGGTSGGSSGTSTGGTSGGSDMSSGGASGETGTGGSGDAGTSGGVQRPYIAATRNQGFIAVAAERLGVGNPVYDALISATAAEARAGFDLLSGEAHAQAVSVMIDESRLVRETILGHLRGPLLTQAPGQVAASFSADLPGRKGAVVMPAPLPQPRYALWGTAFGSTGNTDADGNAASLSRRSGGALLGADVMLYDAPGSSLKVGVAGGYSQSRFDLDARLSTGRLESGHAALYAGARFGSLRFDAGAAYSWSESDVRRQVQIRGFSDLLRLQRPGQVAQGFAELGYAFAFSGFALEPFAQLALIQVSTDAGTERGGAAALRVLSSEQALGFSTLGLRAEAQIGTMPLFARAMLGWRHGFGELTPQARTAFAAGTTPAAVFAARIDREALVAEAGLDWRISQATALGLTYSAAIGERSRDHALKGRVEMRF